MTDSKISEAMRRVESVLGRRPKAGVHADASALAVWDGGTRVLSRHADGACIATDMPEELGGAGDEVTPGWLLRAGLAACLATRTVMEAALRGIVLTHLEVRAESTSDTRGLLGMRDSSGTPVSAAPVEVRLAVQIRAHDAPAEALRALVADSLRCSPVCVALEQTVSVALSVDTPSA
ncbi:MAG: OsmC family protein [Sinobacteraceae bacterium]|nr:OsmC family protein [Nevskiaceae bacterium]